MFSKGNTKREPVSCYNSGEQQVSVIAEMRGKTPNGEMNNKTKEDKWRNDGIQEGY